MRETGSKVTANNDKITISFDRKIRLGPLHTLVEGYLQLTRDQQKQIDYLLESFLVENEIHEEYSEASIDRLAVLSLSDLKTKKERILNIVRNRANPNFSIKGYSDFVIIRSYFRTRFTHDKNLIFVLNNLNLRKSLF